MGSGGATATPENYPPGTYKKDEALEAWLAKQFPACKGCGKNGLSLNRTGWCDTCWWKRHKTR
jgi:hypothetical protein